MPETAVYAPGIPMWIDLSAKDAGKARDFYTKLFGWKADVVEDPQAGGYALCTYDGKVVAGIGPTQDPSGTSAWMQYVCSEDIDALAETVKGAGGELAMGPMKVMDQGSMMIFRDPTGAFCGVWQPDTMHGAELVNAPGSFTWSELNTRDIKAAHPFYKQVFNWGVNEVDFETPDGPGKYTEWQVDGRSIAGGMNLPSTAPAQVPAHWMIYFAVADCDATVETLKGLGGNVMIPPTDIPQGRFAMVTDDQGAPFAVIKMAS